MSIAKEINRLNNAKAAIKKSIENKGVEVKDSALLDEYPALIDSIEVGSGGEGGGADPFYETMWNAITSNNTDYRYLFHKYNGTELDISKLDTSNVQWMVNMFCECTKLQSFDVSNFDTSNATDMSYMFYSCSKLISLDLSSFDTSNVTNMNYMFGYCSSLTSIDVSNFDTSNVTKMNNMFSTCNKLISLDVSHFDVGNVTDMNYFVYSCKALISLDLSNWDISKVTGAYNLASAFDYCPSLVDFYPPKNINANMTVSNSIALSHDSLMRIINNLMTTTSTKTLTLGATNLAKLSSDEIAIATNKGWTLA